VTDWHNYDSIYTERIMLTPEHNPEGYARSAPNNAAKNLKGDLLLLHGTTDDNVHMQNTLQFAYELQKAGIVFDMMLTPTQRHTFYDKDLINQQRKVMWRFIKREIVKR
jgi:dipeptidyl-peptidase-4